MATTPTLFSLLVHHGPTTSIIHDVDRNRYSYMDVSRCIRDCTCGLACKHRCKDQHQV